MRKRCRVYHLLRIHLPPTVPKHFLRCSLDELTTEQREQLDTVVRSTQLNTPDGSISFDTVRALRLDRGVITVVGTTSANVVVGAVNVINSAKSR